MYNAAGPMSVVEGVRLQSTCARRPFCPVNPQPMRPEEKAVNHPRYVPPESLTSRLLSARHKEFRAHAAASPEHKRRVWLQAPRTCFLFSLRRGFLLPRSRESFDFDMPAYKEARSVQGGQRVWHKKGKAWARRVFFFELEQCLHGEHRCSHCNASLFLNEARTKC